MQAESVARRARQRVQIGRTVAVDNTFRIAGGAAGVTHGHRRTLVGLGPGKVLRRRGEQVLVAVHRHVAQATGVPLADQDVGLDRRELTRDGSQHGQDGGVDDHHPVLAVVDDVGQLVGEQPQVQRVQHRAHRRDGQIGLQVLLGVPQEGADAVAGTDAQTGQRAGEPLATGGDLGKAGLPYGSRLEGPDRALGEDGGPVPEHARDGQRTVLHRADNGVGHAVLLSLRWRASRRVRPTCLMCRSPSSTTGAGRTVGG